MKLLHVTTPPASPFPKINHQTNLPLFEKGMEEMGKLIRKGVERGMFYEHSPAFAKTLVNIIHTHT